MGKLKLAIVGCGFWANYQVAAWKEFKDDVEIVGIADRSLEKATEFQKLFDIPQVFDDAETMIRTIRPDLVDIITTPETHADLINLAIKYNTAVICQKPLTPSWEESREIVELCAQNNVPLFVHENWRFQDPIRKVKELIDAGEVGKIFRARITCSHAFPVFENQPNLKEREEMAIADLGIHLLDTARYLFGETSHLYAQTSTVSAGIKGEDVATIILTMESGCQCIVEVSFATKQEIPHFPQTLIHIEGNKGVISVKENYKISLITDNGVENKTAIPQPFKWANPDYAIVHSSIYSCNKSILKAITGNAAGETTGKDNLETLRLTYASYLSAKNNSVVYLKDFI